MMPSRRAAPAAATSAAFLISAPLIALGSPCWAPLAALLGLSQWLSVMGGRA